MILNFILEDIFTMWDAELFLKKLEEIVKKKYIYTYFMIKKAENIICTVTKYHTFVFNFVNK